MSGPLTTRHGGVLSIRLGRSCVLWRSGKSPHILVAPQQRLRRLRGARLRQHANAHGQDGQAPAAVQDHCGQKRVHEDLNKPGECQNSESDHKAAL